MLFSTPKLPKLLRQQVGRQVRLSALCAHGVQTEHSHIAAGHVNRAEGNSTDQPASAGKHLHPWCHQVAVRFCSWAQYLRDAVLCAHAQPMGAFHIAVGHVSKVEGHGMDQHVKADTLLLASLKLLGAKVEKAAKAVCLQKEAMMVEMLGKAGTMAEKIQTPIRR